MLLCATVPRGIFSPILSYRAWLGGELEVDHADSSHSQPADILVTTG